MGVDFFFDTYAFVEILKGNKDYSFYTKAGIITTRLNLMELHYVLLSIRNKQEADDHYARFLPFVVDVTDDVIKAATQLKLQLKRLSYVDCIGYALAQQMNVKIPLVTRPVVY